MSPAAGTWCGLSFISLSTCGRISQPKSQPSLVSACKLWFANSSETNGRNRKEIYLCDSLHLYLNLLNLIMLFLNDLVVSKHYHPGRNSLWNVPCMRHFSRPLSTLSFGMGHSPAAPIPSLLFPFMLCLKVAYESHTLLHAQN